MESPQFEQTRWFTREVQPHEPLLRAYLRKPFPTLHDFDDVVQESHLRLLRAREQGRIESAKAYLFAVARNVARGMKTCAEFLRQRGVTRDQP